MFQDGLGVTLRSDASAQALNVPGHTCGVGHTVPRWADMCRHIASRQHAAMRRRPHNCAVGVLLWAPLVTCVASLAANSGRSALRAEHMTSGFRDAQEPHRQHQAWSSSVPHFPFVLCSDYSAKALPYYLDGPSWTVDDSTQVATITFKVGLRSPSRAGPPTPAEPCWARLEDQAAELLLHIYKACEPAVRLAGWNATLNGQPKEMRVHATPHGATLAISGLGLTRATADGAVVAFQVAAPCNRPVLLFQPDLDRVVALQYAFAESSAERQCCPTSG